MATKSTGIEVYINRIMATLLQQLPDLLAVYQFGSSVTANTMADSDIDLALLLPADGCDITAWQWLTMQQQLEMVLQKPVDLLHLRHVSTVMQKEVVMANQRIWCANPVAADEFELRVIGDYQKLNQERKSIIADGLQHGFYRV